MLTGSQAAAMTHLDSAIVDNVEAFEEYCDYSTSKSEDQKD